MATHNQVIIIINIFIQINAGNQLFSLFHQEIAKRFDRVKHIRSEPIVWYDIRNKVNKYFKDSRGKDSDATMGYFIHVVPATVHRRAFKFSPYASERVISIPKDLLAAEPILPGHALTRSGDRSGSTPYNSNNIMVLDNLGNRRAFRFNRYEGESVVGVPSSPWHLPAAEPILPGHTMIRPTLGMLKSAVTFPHVENEDGVGGASVYGNPSHLGIRYNGRNGRIPYSSNRRMLLDNPGNRRTFKFNRYEGESVAGVPSATGHLPGSDPILPGHTLMRPTLGMLASAVKFPHVDNGDELGGSADYGNPYHIGIRFGGKGDRLPYSINRRMFSNTPGVRDSKAKNLIKKMLEKISSLRSYRHRSTKRQNLFDHIKLNSNKPELSDLIPPDPNKVPRNWWYFNEDDFGQLQAAL